MPKIFKDMSDKELDKLFKDAADQFEPPAAPEGAWDDFYNNYLHSDKDRKKPIFWYTPLIAFWGQYSHLIFSWRAIPVLGLALLIVLWTEYNKKPDNFLVPRQSDKVKTTAPVSPGAGKITADSQYVNSTNPRPSTGTGADKDPGQVNRQDTQAGYAGTAQRDAAAGNNPLSGLPAKDGTGKESNKQEKAGIPAGETASQEPLTGAPAMIAADKEKNNLAKTESPVNNVTGQASEQTATPQKAGLAGLTQKNNANGDSASSQEKKKRKREVYSRSKWNIGLAVGANASVIKGTLSHGLGLNTGLMVQRRFSATSRFSVELGIVRESMTYNVTRNTFHPDGVTIPPSVSNMGGKCTMLDIPLNVRYDVVRSGKGDVFVSTGVSTMWMVKQSYSYQYYNNPPVNQDVTGKGKSILPSANISAGYEQQFKNLSLQIAPYVKIPMSNVGYGNISLGSVGAQISIKKNL
ncbi:Outer membrane protein beta-barrel domain-containing protein [Chitinophaga terrae (ex Kim and Jung 2007)]|uniref:Outer membrane protein beta-barrel domain-containing protein n=2 Tax=Chitinophaga terrae (ex Kim and Jung 2007) TaxID=408074 RepID=A0A1H3Z961_9BACT|nr:outer membrane beta-barrel protein [Chitinophaga terrae (ex Kim and Jung 2007)]SEA20227.1 Outer membrane protein beta-barrel domain-containing protein [Chitinophaga terrae (ex Kim and Jung 2007)]